MNVYSQIKIEKFSFRQFILLMEFLTQAGNNFYDCLCCQTKASFPDPYTFSFGEPSAREKNALIFQSNEITTTKYNILNFLPKSIITQYKRLCNLYFLVVAVLTSIPAVSPLNPAVLWVGVIFVLAVSIVKEAYQDYSRYKIDKEINNEKSVKILRGDELVSVPWGQLMVGDICLIEENEYFPADLILLSTCQDDGVAYIETASLDGQKTSKIRYAFSKISSLYKTAQHLSRLEGTFEGQIPNQSLQIFRGNLIVDGQKYSIVDSKQLLYRGAKLMNTEKVWGLVAYSGQCSKIMMNSQISSSKISVVERRLNWMLIGLFVCQIILCSVVAAMSVAKGKKLQQKAYYLDWSEAQQDTGLRSFIQFLMYFINFSSVIPVSLIVTVELVKLAQSYFIDFDKMMYSSARQRGVLAKTTTLNEQLGQIQYVFTDKTGTLTSNKMTFHTAVIADRQYSFDHSDDCQSYKSETFNKIKQQFNYVKLKKAIELKSQDGKSRLVIKVQEELIHHYLMALLACNTINVVSREDKRIYQSQSPDEIALIKLVRSLGYVFVKRESNLIQVEIGGRPATFKILQKFSFNSDRKRMSVMIECGQQIFLYVKGADNVISQRILPSQFNIEQHISELSKKGLRTLMVGMKIVSPAEYNQLKEALNAAQLHTRDSVVEKYAEYFQNNLTLVGATALLDELQVGVPETLRDFQRADIRVWMLTGDKLETAIEVSKSCNLINRSYEIIQCRPSSKSIEQYLQDWSIIFKSNPSVKYSLVIEGVRLAEIIKNKTYAEKFTSMSQRFTTVVCCRLLPIQKAHTVKLIKQHLGKICLGIGDGSNDVSMIKQAHIGVGLYGQEGMSAVQASDYAIPEFRMIWRLMFIHGRWNYIRISELILYFTYKSILFTMPQIVFTYFNGFSGQPIFDDYYIALYNVVFTSLPLLVRALFQQDVNYVFKENKKQPQEDSENQEGSVSSMIKRKAAAHDVLAEHEAKFLPKGFFIDNLVRWKFPKIYFIGQKHQIFNAFNCSLWIIQSILLGAMSTLLVLFIIGNRPINANGHNSDLWICSITIYSIIIVLTSIKIAMHVRHWTLIFFLSIVVCSLAPYLIYVWISNYALSQYVEGTVIMCFTDIFTYCVVILVTFFAVVIISITVYLTFHSTKMVKKIKLKMQNISEDISETLSIESCVNEEFYGKVANQKSPKKESFNLQDSMEPVLVKQDSKYYLP